MPPRWTKAGIVGFWVFFRLGVSNERSMAVAMAVTVPMSMVVIMRMAMGVCMTGRADSGVLFELLEPSSMERPGISPGGLKTGMR